MPISLRKATVADCELLHGMKRKSFKPILDKYQDYATNPGAEPIERTRRRLCEPNSDFYLIQLDDADIGAIRIVHNGDTCELKQLFILPAHQGNGYAQQTIAFAESLYPGAKRWSLDTISQEEKLCHLYEKMGYRRTGEEKPLADGMTLIFYAKQICPHAAAGSLRRSPLG